jgi:tripartite-type tricarboxylate transporter receptor subunit TctC
MRMHRRAALTALVATGALASTPAHADVAAFYKGNTVRIIVGTSAGGGFDTFGRMVARHLAANIPGSPTIIVQNRPGAGSLTALRSLETSPKDGTTIVMFNPAHILISLLDPEKEKINFSQVAFLGSATADAQACYARAELGIGSFPDLLKHDQVFSAGATGRGSSSYTNFAILKNLFGARVNQILGYSGASQQRLAVERGELDGECGSWDSVPKDWIARKKINVYLRMSRATGRDMPDVAHISDFANAEQKRILDLLLLGHDMFRPFIMAKDVPADRIKAMRDAFWATVSGKPFLDEAERSGRSVIGSLRGDEMEKIVADIYKTPKDLVAKAAAAIQ